MQESFEKLLRSYIGTSIENKAARMKRNEKLHKQIYERQEFIPTFGQAMGLIKECLKFKHSQPCPNVQGKSIQEVLDNIKSENIDTKQA